MPFVSQLLLYFGLLLLAQEVIQPEFGTPRYWATLAGCVLVSAAAGLAMESRKQGGQK